GPLPPLPMAVRDAERASEGLLTVEARDEALADPVTDPDGDAGAALEEADLGAGDEVGRAGVTLTGGGSGELTVRFGVAVTVGAGSTLTVGVGEVSTVTGAGGSGGRTFSGVGGSGMAGSGGVRGSESASTDAGQTSAPTSIAPASALRAPDPARLCGVAITGSNIPARGESNIRP